MARSFLLGMLAAATSGSILAPAYARPAAITWPVKPIRIVVPFPPGGFSDVFGRILGQRFTETWGQATVIENRTGAGGNIGAELVARSAPDGYTLVMGTVGTHAINATLFPKLPYDPIKDFAAVAFVVEAEGLLVAHPSLPVKTVRELLALARARPGDLTYGSAWAGTTGHLAGELFKSMSKVDITHVPYKGNVPAIADLIAGQTSLVFATLPTVLPFVKAGRLRSIAVLGASRSGALPDVPTLAQAGLSGFEVNNWTGMFAPVGAPAAIVTRLNSEVLRIMALPEVRSRMSGEGLRTVAMSVPEFARFVETEVARWGPVVRASGAKAD
ncbi:MAG: tripartite tricarboxylate transporter substrate binding protein [Proteobacteria bacterium]|nr:tripartite tricarboxylate transporter substrate binding protein [Burkholderiales bacterium]